MSCNGSQVKNMDNRVSVEGYGPMSSLSLASRSLRVIALAAALALTACGGGGGGGDDGGGNPPPPDPGTGEIAATVVDQFDAPINGVTITAGSRTAHHGVRRDGHRDTGTDRLGAVSRRAPMDSPIRRPRRSP